MPLSYRSRINAGLLLALCALLTAGLFAYRTTEHGVRQVRGELHRQLLLSGADHVLNRVQDAETGQRGYLLTGDTSYLEPYRDALRRLPAELDTLHARTAARPAHAARVAALDRAVGRKMAELETSIRLHDEQGREAALALVRTHAGRDLMATIRREVLAIESAERAGLQGSAALAERSAARAQVGIRAGMLLALLALAVAGWWGNREASRRRRAERELRGRELLTREMARQFPAGVVLLFDHELRFSLAGGAGLDALGELEGQTLYDALPELVPTLEPRYRAALAGAASSFELSAAGRSYWVQALPLRSDTGRVLCGMALLQDVSEQRRADAETARLGRVLEASSNEIYIFDADSLRFVQVNRGARENLGYRAAELLSMRPTDVQPEFTPDAFRRMLVPLRNGAQRELVYEAKHVRRDGSIYPVEVRIQLVRDTAGDSMIAVASDISRRREAERALRESERRFRSLTENSADLVVVLDAEGVIRFLSGSSAATLGYGQDQLLGRQFLARVHPEDHPSLEAALLGLLTADEPLQARFRCRHRDGSWRVLEGSARNLLREAAVGGIVVNCRDVTEQVVAEEALRESEHRYRRLAEASYEGIFFHAGEQILDCNEAGTHMFGRELRGCSVLEAIAEPHRAEVAAWLLGGGEESYESLGVRADGSTFPVEIHGREVPSVGESTRVTVVRDLTERKRVENALRESNELLETVIRSSPLAIVAMDLEGRVTLWNPAADQLFGWSEAEVLGGPLPYVPESDRERHADMRARVLRGDNLLAHEVERCRKDGTPIFISISTALLHGADGAASGIVSVNADVTERRAAEERLERYSRELERSNRELQDFAYVASHDLQEPLRKIQAFGDRLRSKFGAELGAQGDDYLARMQGAARRMQQLVEDLLTLSRVSTRVQPFLPVDLTEVATEVLGDLQARIDATGATVEIGALPTVEADRTQMRQLLQNLIGNALKYHQPDVAPVVRVRAEGLGRRARLLVEDNGIGFEPKHHDRIFQPFQRLHGRTEFEGTGMGLAICRKIAERHNGQITARSAPGEGSTFVVTLPLQQPVHAGIHAAA